MGGKSGEGGEGEATGEGRLPKAPQEAGSTAPDPESRYVGRAARLLVAGPTGQGILTEMAGSNSEV